MNSRVYSREAARLTMHLQKFLRCERAQHKIAMTALGSLRSLDQPQHIFKKGLSAPCPYGHSPEDFLAR
jgi:hypothetical protein